MGRAGVLAVSHKNPEKVPLYGENGPKVLAKIRTVNRQKVGVEGVGVVVGSIALMEHWSAKVGDTFAEGGYHWRLLALGGLVDLFAKGRTPEEVLEWYEKWLRGETAFSPVAPRSGSGGTP